MRVLLLTPPYKKGFMRNARWDVIGIAGGQWYPIYLAYCTGLLESRGHFTKLIDAQVEEFTKEETEKIVLDFAPELIVMYYSYKALQNDLEIAKRLREITKSELVLVGPSASIESSKTLEKADGINMIAVGEFDFTILEIANGLPKENIRGLIWKDANNNIIVNESREPVTSEQLNEFPFVTDVYRRHLTIKRYFQPDPKHPYVDLFTGRGCNWGLCTFCLWPCTINKGAGYRTRKIDNIVAELCFISEKMSYIKEVFFQDDTLPKDRAVEISEAILKNNLKVCWSCYARPTQDMDYQTLKLMKKAGCRTLHVGYESSNQVILKNIKKGTTVSSMEQFTRNAIKAGLYIVADILVGLPGETIETIKATTYWARKLPVQRYTISLPKPYPETPFYIWLKENGYLKDGRPNYPHLSSEEIYRWNKWAYRKVYFSPHYFFRMLTKPQEWDRLIRSAKHAIPYLLNKEAESAKELEW